jgi:TPR repeat protein
MKKQLLIILFSMLPMVIFADKEGKCGENVTYYFEEASGTLTIKGSGPMQDFKKEGKAPWGKFCDKINHVIIENGVTSIGKYAFAGWSTLDLLENFHRHYYSFSSVSIPNSVTSIGEYAFYYCTNLSSVTIPDGISSIKEYTFYGCKSLIKVNLPNSINSIHEYAFRECSLLKSITLPSHDVSVHVQAFEFDTKIQKAQKVQNHFEEYINAANAGDANAQTYIGYCYYKGEGVSQDNQQAVYWYKKAAEQGAATAQAALGACYGEGLGVTQDYSQATYWYRKAAEQGHVLAQVALGDCYFRGHGVVKDYLKAEELYKKAAEKGNANVMNTLGWHYYLGDGFKKDYQKAEMWFKKAIETDENSPYPYSNMALLYAQRDKNYTEALRYSDMAIARIANKSPTIQAGFYGERGQVYVWKGDMENAEKMLQKCLELNPKYLEGNDEFSKMMVSFHSNEIDSKIITNPATNKNTFAIIIGNEKYKNEVSVPFANNDAKIFKEYVENTLGVPYDQIRFVENAGYNDLRMAVNWLVQAMTVCRGKGKAIVYYAGHGIPNESDLSSYLLPVDGIGNDPASGYSLKELYEKLGNVEAQSITVFLDACFSGSKREEGMLTSARGVAIKVKPAAPTGNLIVFSAAQGDETAYPYKDKQHGMFTYFLLKKLQETKGDVSLGDLSDYLTEEVGRQSFIKNNKMQTPTVNVSSSLQNSWRNMKLK